MMPSQSSDTALPPELVETLARRLADVLVADYRHWHGATVRTAQTPWQAEECAT